MVNLIQAKEQFAAYCKGYDTQDERVALKIVHSQKVAEIQSSWRSTETALLWMWIWPR